MEETMKVAEVANEVLEAAPIPEWTKLGLKVVAGVAIGAAGFVAGRRWERKHPKQEEEATIAEGVVAGNFTEVDEDDE